MAVNCEACGKAEGLFSSGFKVIRGKNLCKKCAQDFIDETIRQIIMTTTVSVDGYKVARYIDIESVEVVIGTGVFSEFTGDISDFFGMRSTAFERKLQSAKEAALARLKYKAFEKGGNAVIGVDMDYTEFSDNRIGVIVSGTIVELESMF